jgi:myosin heavy subunit
MNCTNGALNFYGIEVIDRNYFEQSSINHVNDKRRQTLINLIPKTEQEEVY